VSWPRSPRAAGRSPSRSCPPRSGVDRHDLASGAMSSAATHSRSAWASRSWTGSPATSRRTRRRPSLRSRRGGSFRRPRRGTAGWSRRASERDPVEPLVDQEEHGAAVEVPNRRTAASMRCSSCGGKSAGLTGPFLSPDLSAPGPPEEPRKAPISAEAARLKRAEPSAKRTERTERFKKAVESGNQRRSESGTSDGPSRPGCGLATSGAAFIGLL